MKIENITKRGSWELNQDVRMEIECSYVKNDDSIFQLNKFPAIVKQDLY